MTGAQTIKELIDLSRKTTMEVDSLWLTESLPKVAETQDLSLTASISQHKVSIACPGELVAF